MVSTTAGSNGPARVSSPVARKIAPTTTGGMHQGAALAEPDHADQPGDERAGTGAATG